MYRIIFTLIVLCFCSDNTIGQTAVLDWAFQMGDSSGDLGTALTLTKNEDVLTTGYFQGKVDFDPDTSTKYLTTTNSIDTYVQKLNAAGGLIWVKQIKQTDSNRMVIAQDIVVDHEENIIICGRFSGTVDFDPDTAVHSITSSSIESEGFILKLDSAGKFIWVAHLKGNGFSSCVRLSVDSKGNVITGGIFWKTLDFNPGSASYNLTSIGYSDAFMVKLDTGGAFLWAHQIGSKEFELLNGITADENDNIYATGSFQDTVDFNPSSATYNLISNYPLGDIFVAKYSNSGSFVWARSMGSSGDDMGMDLVSNFKGGLYITGSFQDTVDFDPSSSTNSLTSGKTSPFILKFTDSGNFVWVKGIIGSSGASGVRICLDAEENVYVTGIYYGWQDFDPSSSKSILYSKGLGDVFLQRLDSNGNFMWARSMGGPSWEHVGSHSVNSKQELFLNGTFVGTADFDPSIGKFDLVSVDSSYDAFVVKLSQCNPVYIMDSIQTCDSLTWIDGITYTADNYSAHHTLVGGSKGTCDTIALLQLKINYSSKQFDTVIACNSYTWRNGKTYNQSINNSIYVVDGAASNGCDSVYYLMLTINNPIVHIDTVNGCDSFTWIDGITYYASTDTAHYTYTSGAKNGCDSIVNLKLTLYKTLHSFDTFSACDSITWIDGKTYTYSTDTLKYRYSGVVKGVCDSVVHLNLTIKKSSHVYDTIVTCDSFTWVNGTLYNKSVNDEIYTIKGAANNGCDSVLHLNLTVLNRAFGYDTITTCSTYTWIDGNKYTTSNGSASYLFSGGAKNGCDSIAYLKLSIFKPVFVYDTVITCDSFKWIDGNFHKTSSNSLSFTYAAGATNGCDSTVFLDLTIHQSGHYIDAVSACDSYTWIDGKTYYVSDDTSIFIIPSGAASGCDSIIHLKLSLKHSKHRFDTIQACDSFIWIDGKTYFKSDDTSIFSIPKGASSGCDSIIHLKLTLYKSKHHFDTVQACDSFKWINGVTYTTSTDTLEFLIVDGATSGCDSVMHLSLKIKNPVKVFDTISVCDSLIWLDGYTYKNSIASLIYVFSNGAQNGCDSIIYLNLNVNKTATFNDTIRSCNSFTWIDGITYNESIDTLSYRIQSGAKSGCDSIIYLSLNIDSVSSKNITATDTSLISDNLMAKYQWLDCDKNFAPITGENNRAFIFKSQGNFAVQLTENQCIDTSECIAVKFNGINEIHHANQWLIYPNPNWGIFKLRFESNFTHGLLNIFDMRGKLVYAYTNKGQTEVEIDSKLTSGIYTLIYGTSTQIATKVMLVY